MKCLIATKLGMSQMFQEDGTVVPVTLLHATPSTIAAIKTVDTFGYNALVVANGEQKSAHPSAKGQVKHLKDCSSPRTIAEFRTRDSKACEQESGTSFDVSQFENGEAITISGVSKGKGFQGVVKRHGFAGAEKTHGHKHDLRKPGSIGCAFPQHVLKGRRMAGRMGGDQRTIQTSVVHVDNERSLIAVKGSIPGPKKSTVKLYTS